MLSWEQFAKEQNVVARRAGHPLIVTCAHYHMTLECHGVSWDLQ